MTFKGAIGRKAYKPCRDNFTAIKVTSNFIMVKAVTWENDCPLPPVLQLKNGLDTAVELAAMYPAFPQLYPAVAAASHQEQGCDKDQGADPQCLDHDQADRPPANLH